MLDNFSHYADAHPLQQAPASECAKALLRWVYIYGVPQEVRSDRGLNLNLSEVFKELYKLLGVTSILGQPYAPQSNSVERFHRRLGAALRILFYDSDLDVDESLGAILMIWRSTVCRVTGFTPAMLHFGREMRFPTDAFSSTTVAVSPEEYVHHVQQQMQAVWQAARTAQQIAQDESAHYYNLKHGVVRDIAQGSHVFKWKLPRYQGEVSTHLLPRCTGPYKVLQISGRGAKLQHCVSGKTTTASLRHIKPAYLRAGDDQLMDGSSALYTEGKIVIVRLAAARNAVRKWQVCRLDHTTMDEDAWIVQWYNSHDDGFMLEKRYYSAWEKTDGTEIYAASRADPSWVPVTWTVHKGRFLTGPFELKHAKIPPTIKSRIKAMFGDKSEPAVVPGA